MTSEDYKDKLTHAAIQFMPCVMRMHPDWDYQAQVHEAIRMAQEFLKGIYGSVAEVK